MNHRQKLGYTALGAIIMLIGLGIGTIVAPPLTAQRDPTIEHIQCASLTIVDENGQPALQLSSDGDGDGDSHLNYLTIYQPGGKQHAIDIFAMTQSTGVMINNENERPVIFLTNKPDGTTELILKDYTHKGSVEIGLRNQLAQMSILDRRGDPAISLSHLPILGNQISIRDKYGIQGAVLESNSGFGNRLLFYDANDNKIWTAP